MCVCVPFSEDDKNAIRCLLKRKRITRKDAFALHMFPSKQRIFPKSHIKQLPCPRAIFWTITFVFVLKCCVKFIFFGFGLNSNFRMKKFQKINASFNVAKSVSCVYMFKPLCLFVFFFNPIFRFHVESFRILNVLLLLLILSLNMFVTCNKNHIFVLPLKY